METTLLSEEGLLRDGGPLGEDGLETSLLSEEGLLRDGELLELPRKQLLLKDTSAMS